jgi:hypothetical protein
MKRAFNQQPNPDPKPEAVTSLVFGIISLLLNVNMVHSYLETEYIGDFPFLWGWLIPILGFILGIMGLIPRRNRVATLALVGTILSFVGLVTYICVVYMCGWTSDVVIPPFNMYWYSW